MQSRDFRYLLHCVSVQEKDQLMHDLWEQHTEEMKILTVCNKDCTVEFQPGADMSWQSWAANELNQAAKYPSPYANVHKGNMCTMGGSIGFSDNDTLKPFTLEKRKSHVEKVRNFMSSLSSSLTEKNRHARKLQFMAENGIRQLGLPRIGQFADRLRPEPMHFIFEINAWQHYIYNIFDPFVSVLAAPLGRGDEDDIDAVQLQKSLVKISSLESVGERARQQDLL